METSTEETDPNFSFSSKRINDSESHEDNVETALLGPRLVSSSIDNRTDRQLSDHSAAFPFTIPLQDDGESFSEPG
jgi:hypothetical protein